MKILIALSALFLLAASFTAKHMPDRKFRILPYHIVSTEADSTLDQNHCLFEVHFVESGYYRGNNPLEKKDTLIWPKLEYSCNGVIRNLQLDYTMMEEVIVSPGKYAFSFYAEGYGEIFTDSIPIEPGHRTIVNVYLRRFSDSQPEMLLKPVIYVYSPDEQEIDVALSSPDPFSFTYPAYEKGWKGMAHPDGSMTISGKMYPYLFWESERDNAFSHIDLSSGFVVKSTEVIPFLEKQLSAMGMNDKEQADFITFWGPRMQSHDRGLVHFMFNEEYSKEVAGLTVTPAPQSVFRVYMLFVPLEEGSNRVLRPQVIPRADRTGFHVIEWGGSELSPSAVSQVQAVSSGQ